MYWRTLRRAPAARRLLVVALAGALLAPAPAALSLVPPKPNVFLGVSDRGTTTEFNEFAELTGKHPALLQTFHPWGNSLNEAYERWRETATRPILAHLHRRRPDAGGADHAAADRPRRRRRLPAAAEPVLRRARPARLHPAAGRAEPLPQRLVGGQLRRHPERRRTHDRLVQAGLPPHRRDRPRRPEPGRGQRDAGGNRAAAGQPDQRPAADRTAGGAGEHHLEPAAGRLAAGQRQLPRQLLARAAAGSTGSAPTSTPSIRSGKTSTASTRASSGRASRWR